MRHQAIRALYPSVVTIDHLGAYDADGKVVSINEENVTTKENELVARQVIIAKIKKLEAEVTPRRVRDAFADPGWMNAQEAKIKIERDKL